MDAKIVKLEEIEKKYLELGDLLSTDEVASDVKQFTKLSKQQAQLKGAFDAYQEYKTLNNTINEANEMLNDEDEEIREMAKMELEEAGKRLPELEAHIQSLLLPKDPEDAYDCLVEIRGAAGGDEGNIFAGDLYRMYCYYADSLGYKTEVMEASESEAGGYTLISFMVKGLDAYRHFKFESGAHRVQRVPKTETQGRVHTSTATVIVFPDVEEEDVEIADSDLEIETHRASGAGGQHINKTSSAIRITHIPTGTVVECQDQRSQHQNREKAMLVLRARLLDAERAKQDAAIAGERKAQVGTGDRSERIRTYNYPQGRVSDHRINLTLYKLEAILNGDMDELIDALITADTAEKLKAQSES